MQEEYMLLNKALQETLDYKYITVRPLSKSETQSDKYNFEIYISYNPFDIPSITPVRRHLYNFLNKYVIPHSNDVMNQRIYIKFDDIKTLTGLIILSYQTMTKGCNND